MKKRLACQGLLIVASLALCSCSLLRAPLNILGGLLGLGTRLLSVDANDSRAQPFRLETGELQRCRGLPAVKPLAPTADRCGNVAVVRQADTGSPALTSP